MSAKEFAIMKCSNKKDRVLSHCIISNHKASLLQENRHGSKNGKFKSFIKIFRIIKESMKGRSIGNKPISQ